MMAALKAVATGDVEGGRLDLTPGKGTVQVSARDDDGNEARVEAACYCEAVGPLAIGFNVT
jgi:hypothetical protein